MLPLYRLSLKIMCAVILGFPWFDFFLLLILNHALYFLLLLFLLTMKSLPQSIKEGLAHNESFWGNSPIIWVLDSFSQLVSLRLLFKITLLIVVKSFKTISLVDNKNIFFLYWYYLPSMFNTTGIVSGMVLLCVACFSLPTGDF